MQRDLVGADGPIGTPMAVPRRAPCAAPRVVPVDRGVLSDARLPRPGVRRLRAARRPLAQHLHPVASEGGGGGGGGLDEEYDDEDEDEAEEEDDEAPLVPAAEQEEAEVELAAQAEDEAPPPVADAEEEEEEIALRLVDPADGRWVCNDTLGDYRGNNYNQMMDRYF